ncbi:MAG: hypothetical protein KDA58_05930, partial [Planctomycetaceae bacterium]|nr:hypothetical protein [Planctomycetaceae bacterium]
MYNRFTLACGLWLGVQVSSVMAEVVTVNSNYPIANVYLLQHGLQHDLLGHPEIKLQWTTKSDVGLDAQITVNPTSHGRTETVTVANSQGDLLILASMNRNRSADLAQAILDAYEKHLHAERLLRIALIPPAPGLLETELHSGPDMVNRLGRILLADPGISIVPVKDSLKQGLPVADRYLALKVSSRPSGKKYTISVQILDSQRKEIGHVKKTRALDDPQGLVLDAEFYADLANQLNHRLGRPRSATSELVTARWELPSHMLPDAISYFGPAAAPSTTPPVRSTPPIVSPSAASTSRPAVPGLPPSTDVKPPVRPQSAPVEPPTLDKEFQALLDEGKWTEVGNQLKSWLDELMAK